MLAVLLEISDMTESQKTRFETVYYKYRRLLFTIIRKRVSCDSDAEDILQNTFIKIARNIDKLGDTESKETIAFLTVIAKNTAYDFLRKNSGCEEINIEEIGEIVTQHDSISELISNIEYERIVECIRKIPSPYAEVMFLHYVKDYSIKQTAKLLERKPQTVKMQLVRGKKILIKNLSEVRYD